MAVDIKKSKQLLSDELTHSNLVVHTFCGCDTNQGCILVYDVQYYKNLGKIKNSEIYLGPLASDRKDILQAGEKILLLLLVGKREKTLGKLRVH